jgi:uncharacterized protein YbbC (DUF1343 family)
MVESPDFIDPQLGIPVFSLYGEVRRPTAAMMDSFDVLLVDLQDLGCRIYTFITTLRYVLEEAARLGKTVWVLDRPNPQGGVMIEGPVLEPAFASFVGSFAMPVRHGMTFGELAQMFVGEEKLRTHLRVIPMRGWRRDLAPYVAWDLPWVPPSPNMRSPRTAAVYPGTALFEGTNLSEGRGSEKPFEYIGAPFIDGAALAERLNAMGLLGVTFAPISFTPDFSKNAGQPCHGVWVIPSNSTTFQPFRTGIALVKAVHDLYPDTFEFRAGTPSFFDQLAGTDTVRKGILDGKTVSEIEAQWQPGLDAFRQLRARYLIYP